jgi:hypothetical protein
MRSTGCRTVFMILVIILALGCSSPERRAQKLFNAGRYEDVIRLYPELGIAQEARCKIAERLLSEGQYREILDHYGNTPSAHPALERLAERLLLDGQFEKVAIDYPSTPAAAVAKDTLAERLYRQRKYRDVLDAFPSTKAAEKVGKYHPEVRKAIEEEERARKQREEREREIAEQREKKVAAEKRTRCRRNPSACLRIGMGQWEVVELIGRPNDINRTTYSALGEQHVNEQWIYEIGGYYSFDAFYLYFDDGVLTGWQE